MALRVKNIQQGFVDATGFHPIRASADYNDDRTGDNYEPAPRRRKVATKKRATKKVAKPKRKTAAKRKPVAKRKPARKVATMKGTKTRRRNPGMKIAPNNLRVVRTDIGKVVSTHKSYVVAKEKAVALAKRGIPAQIWDNMGLYLDYTAIAAKHAAKRTRNPLPIGMNWTKASIRRDAAGDLQIMLPLPHRNR